MIHTSRLPTSKTAALGVIGLALLIGVIFLVRVTSLPAYEATAELVVEFDYPFAPSDDSGRLQDPKPDLEEERLIFASPRIASVAATLSADLDSGQFVWYEPDPLNAPLPFDTFTILNSNRIETDADSDRILVHFRADEPTVARVGANLVAEAYRQERPEITGRPSCMPPPRTAGCPPLDPVTVSIAFAPTPNRIDRPDRADVVWFVLVSTVVAYITWRRWPDPQRHVERPVRSAPTRT